MMLILLGVAIMLIGVFIGMVATSDDKDKAAQNKKAWDEYAQWMETEEGMRYDSLSRALYEVGSEDSAAIEAQLKEIVPVEVPKYRAEGIGTFLGWTFGGLLIAFGLLPILLGVWLKRRNADQTDRKLE